MEDFLAGRATDEITKNQQTILLCGNCPQRPLDHSHSSPLPQANFTIHDAIVCQIARFLTIGSAIVKQNSNSNSPGKQHQKILQTTSRNTIHLPPPNRRTNLHITMSTPLPPQNSRSSFQQSALSPSIVRVC